MNNEHAAFYKETRSSLGAPGTPPSEANLTFLLGRLEESTSQLELHVRNFAGLNAQLKFTESDSEPEPKSVYVTDTSPPTLPAIPRLQELFNRNQRAIMRFENLLRDLEAAL